MSKQWKCTVCGYVHIGDEPPDTCPVCGADRDQFVPLAAEKPATGSRLNDGKENDWSKIIVSLAADAVLAADASGTIRLWNHGAERIFRVPAAEAIGQTLDLIIPENLRQRHWEGWGQVMRSGESRYGEELLRVPAVRSDGSRFSAEFSIVMLKDEAGKVAGVAAILRDVSEQREREQQLQEQLVACHKQASE